MTSRPIDRVLEKLDGVRSSGDTTMARCPAHEDRHQSLSISSGDDGRVLLFCHAGCRVESIVGAIGLTLGDLYVAETPRSNGTKVVAEYPYLDEQGELLKVVVRFDPKDFRQKAPDGRGGWRWNVRGVRDVPYWLPELLEGIKAGRWIIIVEGEKDVDTLRARGFVATCNSGGADKWREEYADHFPRAKVAIIPDNDTPGRNHAERIARSLVGIASTVRVVELAGLAEKQDVSDWFAAGGTDSELKLLIEKAPEWLATRTDDDAEVGVAEPRDSSEDHKAFFRLRQGVDIAMLEIRWLWDRRIPLGAVTLIPGREGLGKTTLTYEIAARCSRGQLDGDLHGEPCDVIVIGHEDTIGAVSKPRLLAAGADMARVWFLESTEPEIVAAFTVPVDVPELNRLLDVVPNPRLVIVDPLDAHLGVDTHKKADTQRAIGALALVAQQRELSVAGIAHHSKSMTTDALDRVNGSKAFTTTARSVLTIAPHPENDAERVIACSKANLTRRESVEVLRFRIEERTVTEGEVTATTSGVVWLGVAEGVHPDSVLERPSEDVDDTEDAKDVLERILEDGPTWMKTALAAMAEAGFSKDQAKRAKQKLKVKSVKIGAPGDDVVGWKWQLPVRREHEESEGSAPQDPALLAPLALPSDRDRLRDAAAEAIDL